MATAFISTSAELVLLNTTTRAGVVILPTTTTIPGRILTFKDTRGTFGTNPITFSTAAANQSLENNAIRLTYNDPFGSYSFLAGYDNKWYTIGGSRMYAASISSITTISLTSQAISSGNITVSTLQFRDTATTSTNTLFSLSTNVYYSSPVSFFSLGPTKAPKPLFVPTRRPFLPTQISGNILWLDAADPNVFTGGTIWYDKSGTLNNATNGTPGSTNMPTVTKWTNGLNAAQFIVARANSMKTTNVIPAFNVSYFLVLRINTLVTPLAQNFIMINNVDGQRQLDTASTTFPTNLRFTTNSPSGSPTINNSVGQSEGFLVALTIPTTTAGTTFAYFNGSITPSASQTPLYTPATANSTHYFGSANGSSGYITADYGEILIYNTVLSQANQQQVEGYLAWKWGVVGNLPSNHPYKNSPP